MKIFLILVLFFFYNIDIFSQFIYEGKFKIKDDYSNYVPEIDVFQFEKDRSVILKRWTDIGTIYGVGKYSIKKDKLEIVFETTPDAIKNLFNSSYEITDEYLNPDSAILNMNIYDEESKIFSGVYVRVMGNIDTFTYIADKNGNANIKIPMNEFPIKIRTSYIGFESLEMLINDSLSKKINVSLKKPAPAYFRAGDKQTFNIKYMEKNSFFIKSRFYEEWLPYRRIE